MTKVIDFFRYKNRKSTSLEIVRDIILRSNNLKTIECLCRISKTYAEAQEIHSSVHCLESMKQEIDDLLDRVKEQGGFLVFDQ